ncbi:MAG: response regulator transcription factor [Bacilli bacterium]|nr:response regulator transcription factor [Bacilli bacterium]MDD4608363.1 response regulator transcription factor [Bacilli bacterium]
MQNENKKILVVDDEKAIVEVIKAYLEKEKFKVIVAYDGETALSLFEKEKPDLIVLDLMLPIISGEVICETIRKHSKVPIIMLSAKINEESKLNGFSLGTDDYMTKPFSPKELVARIYSIFSRINQANPEVITINNDLKIDFTGVTVEKRGKLVKLTPYEFKILSVLAKHPQITFSRDDLINLVFIDNYDVFERTIDSHIKNLRSKIEDDDNKYIITVRGFGYKFINK